MKIIPDSSQLKKRRNEKIHRKMRKGSVLFGVILISVLGSKALAEAVAIQSIDLEKRDFSAQDEIVLDSGFYTVDEPKVELINQEGESIEPAFEVTESDEIIIKDPEKLEPGKYRYVLYDGKQVVFSENFTWGVLAINTNKALYTKGDEVKFSFAVLDDMGNMVCDANLKLTITNENGEKTTLQTPNEIKVNPECTQHDFTLIPDYETKFEASGIGTYTLTLDAQTKAGDYTIYDSFKVEEKPDFDVERISATRLYPLNKYPMEIIIKANKDFKGQITETLPSEFEIEQNPTTKEFDTSRIEDELRYISWDVDLEVGEIIKIGYVFDSPNISPEEYRAGKLKFTRNGKVIQNVVEEIELETKESSESTYSELNTTKTLLQEVKNLTITEFEELRYWVFANDAVDMQDATRTYTTGFELNSTTADMEYTSNINSPTISNSTYRSGAYALNTAVSGSNSTEGIGIQFIGADSSAAWTSRAYIRIATLPNTTTDIMQYTSTDTTLRLAVRMTTSGALQLYSYSAGAQVGSDSSTLSTNTWYRIEMWGDGAAAGSAEMGLRIDGVSVASTSTGQLATSLAVLNIGILTSAQADFYWDDVAINTDSYSEQDNWPGEGKVVYLRPNGNGTNTAWTGDYTAVDESPTPNDGTDYINCTASSQLEDYTYQDSSDVGIGENDIIRLMEAWTRTSASTSTSRNHQLSLSDAGGTDTPSVTAVASTSWNTDDDAYPRNASIVAYDDIGSGNYAALTPADVDNIQTQLDTTDCSPNTQITAIWIVVEYVPAKGGRIFSSGFELQSTTAGMEWSGVTGTISTTTGVDRSGDASLSIDSLGSGKEESVAYNFTLSGTDYTKPIFFRSYIYITTAPGSANRIIEIKNNAGTAIAYMTLDNSRILRLYDEDGQVGSASAALGTSTWYRIEMKVDASGSGSTDTVEGKIDGSTFATSGSRNLSTGVRTYLVGGNLNSEANTTGLWYFDDSAININVGSVQNSYPGYGRIVHLNPDDNGSYATAWTGTYTNIDETTPNDATDVVSSTTLDQAESQTLEDSSTAGIPANTTISLVSAGVRMGSPAVSAVTLRVFDSTGTRIESPALLTDSSGNYFTNSFSEPYIYPMTMYTRPMVTSSWTTSELDNAQLGQRLIVDGGSGNFNVSTVWLLVEYDDSITISGTCDAFDQTTDCGDTGTIRFAVNGNLQFATQETVAGTWSITGIPAPATNDIITVFIDGASNSDEAVTVAKYDGSNGISGIKLYKEHLTVGSDDNQSVTNTNLGQYDNSVSGDEDVFFDVDAGVLYVDDTAQSSQEELYIDSGDTFAPGGNVTTHSVEIDGTFSLGTNTLNLGGNFDNDGTFTVSNSTVTVTGTGTSTITGATTFYNFTSTAAGKTIAFETSGSPVFTFNNTFTMTGSGVDFIYIKSSTDGVDWLADFAVEQNGSTYVDVDDSGCSSSADINFDATSNDQGTNGTCWVFPAGNTAPNSPSSLAQKKTTDVTLATGDWTNETSVKFTVTASDTDNPDTLYLCIEKDQLGTAFSDTEDSCGSGTAYSGSPVTLSHTIASLSNGAEYHWQARVKDTAGAYSAWVQYGGNAESARDFGVDTSAPTGGTVFDGEETGVDHDFNDGNLDTLRANWSGFSDAASGIASYSYIIGTTPSGSEILTDTSAGTGTTMDENGFSLRTSQLYYTSVRATDNAGNVQTYVSSDGQAVAPTLSFAISPSSVTFSNLNTANSYTDTETTTLTTTTNAYNGYVIRAFQSALLTSTIYPGTTIANYSGGSYASPDEFLSGDLGFGYTSSDTSVQGSNIFGATPCAGGGNPPCYAPFSLTGPGDIVADHTATVAGQGIESEQFTITYKVRVDATQKASPYSTTIIYTVIPIF